MNGGDRQVVTALTTTVEKSHKKWSVISKNTKNQKHRTNFITWSLPGPPDDYTPHTVHHHHHHQYHHHQFYRSSSSSSSSESTTVAQEPKAAKASAAGAPIRRAHRLVDDSLA
jgi:hypothetical protein